ncbi:MAG: YggS family pyridoxal phosphate-dependent enzyme [Thermodesulfobacteriota bacterium]|nr:YggS family pyridoxal phosphate-dependent enzyme [Thermodesulfobacteriota bacterium]
MKDIIESLRKRIQDAAIRCNRDPGGIRLIGVTKTKPVERVEEGIAAGLTDIGENYIQEARDKIAGLSGADVTWHFIGHLQSNKAKYAVPLFDWIHTVDSLKLAREINKQAEKQEKVQKILMEVNISGEASKAGVSPDNALSLADEISRLPDLSLRGLMTMPPFFDDPEAVRPYFAQLRKLARTIAAQCLPNIRMEELSMGMTGDFEVAIEEGATMIRIGTAIFGARQ